MTLQIPQTRRTLICAGLATATGLAMVALTGGAAADTASTRETDTLRLVATTTAFTTTGGKDLKAGDILAYKDSLATGAGKKVGKDHCFCVAVDKDHLVCDGVLTLPGGTLTFTQPFRNSTQKGTGAITGGTGRYAGASGVFTAVGRPNTDPFVYDYTIRVDDVGGEGFEVLGNH